MDLPVSLAPPVAFSRQIALFTTEGQSSPCVFGDYHTALQSTFGLRLLDLAGA